MSSLKLNSRHSLSRQLVIPLVLSLVAIITIITGMVFLDMGNNLERVIKKNLITTAEKNKTQLETLFQYRGLNTAAWATLEVMNDIITDDVDGRISRTLQDLKMNYQLHGDVLVFNLKNQLIAASNDDYIYQQSIVLPPEWQIPISNDLSFSSKHVNPFSQQLSVAFIHTISASFNTNKKLGFIIVTVPWQDIEALVLPRNSLGMLLDQTGKQLISSNLRQDQVDRPLLREDLKKKSEFTVAGIDYLFGSAYIDNVLNMPLNWLILNMESRKQAFIPMRTLGINILFVGLLLIALVVWLVISLTRRVVTPIQQLTETVLDIAQSSDLSKRVTITSDNEMGVLAESVNRMTEKLADTMSEKDHYADRLASLNKTLEQQVTNRTEDYRLANEELKSTINQLQQAQMQLIQSEKMASLGQLVAGIAHEINNPLGSINANIPILVDYTTDLFNVINSIEDQSIITESLAEIDYSFVMEDTPALLTSMRNAANRMKGIVLSLRNFSRLDQAEVQDILLEEAIDTTLALLMHRLKENITVIKDYQLKEYVPCYAGLINQVLMNLLANAEQAIGGEGTITIKTWRENNLAYTSIQDSGSGIKQDILTKIFDPFFTTKAVGVGTGMGLSISYGIIEKHSGSISVTSELGIGSTFTICLPMIFIQQPQEIIEND